MVSRRHLVSTHSRPKAAGVCGRSPLRGYLVSTHSRPKAAGLPSRTRLLHRQVSTHSRPKAAGPIAEAMRDAAKVSTHSRPKAAGRLISRQGQKERCFNTQPPEGGWFDTSTFLSLYGLFQHTAARRRLAFHLHKCSPVFLFQHTAARRRLVRWIFFF